MTLFVDHDQSGQFISFQELQSSDWNNQNEREQDDHRDKAALIHKLYRKINQLSQKFLNIPKQRNTSRHYY